MNEMEAVNSIE